MKKKEFIIDCLKNDPLKYRETMLDSYKKDDLKRNDILQKRFGIPMEKQKSEWEDRTESEDKE